MISHKTIKDYIQNITQKHILQAIQEIDEKGIPEEAQSTDYDVIYEGKSYPPKYLIVIANKYANGSELSPNELRERKDTPCFKLLEGKGFEIKPNGPLADLVARLKPKVEEAGFKIGDLYPSWIWIGDKEGVIGDEKAHYEFKKRKNSVFLEIHFEDKENKKLFKEQIAQLPDPLTWFGWHGSESIRYMEYDFNEVNLEDKLLKGLIEFDKMIGDEIRNVVKNLKNLTSFSEQKIKKKDFSLNTILYGPPGTGKTYRTILRAAEIIEEREITSYSEALEIFNKNLHERIEFITFHQNYSYEDFIQGLRPDTENDSQLTFERKDGVFKVIADKALQNLKESEDPQLIKNRFEEVFDQFFEPLIEGDVQEIEVKMKKVSYFITAINNKSIEFKKASGGSQHTLSIETLKKMYLAESTLGIKGLGSYYEPLLKAFLKLGKDQSGKKNSIERKNYVIIIDEINRANISRVFGELITLIEPDKRSHGSIPLEVQLPSGDSFMVPSNLYIIGTMNTADKSIALLDIALRRRFEFESMYPEYEIDGQEIYDVEILKKINKQIIESKGHDFQIGHSYFMGENKDLVERMNKKVIPLLLEYFMNDMKEVKGILQSAGLSVVENSWPLKISAGND